MRYPFAERFKAPQGEGLFTGTQMAFVRLVGCSVGQKVCTACDTDFSQPHSHLGGGLFTPEEVVSWADDCRHLCITGGEPLDRNLLPLVLAARAARIACHIETSGTQDPQWLADLPADNRPWVTVSPKPGYKPGMIHRADELKVIVGGLGDGPGWPTVADAVRWADSGKLVYVQPRNRLLDVDLDALSEVLAVISAHPQLRLSAQLHKFVKTR